MHLAVTLPPSPSYRPWAYPQLCACHPCKSRSQQVPAWRGEGEGRGGMKCWTAGAFVKKPVLSLSTCDPKVLASWDLCPGMLAQAVQRHARQSREAPRCLCSLRTFLNSTCTGVGSRRLCMEFCMAGDRGIGLCPASCTLPALLHA